MIRELQTIYFYFFKWLWLYTKYVVTDAIIFVVFIEDEIKGKTCIQPYSLHVAFSETKSLSQEMA